MQSAVNRDEGDILGAQARMVLGSAMLARTQKAEGTLRIVEAGLEKGGAMDEKTLVRVFDCRILRRDYRMISRFLSLSHNLRFSS